MRRKKSILLFIGLPLSTLGGLLIANPFGHEPLWLQWGVGFACFYLGLPLIMLGAAIYFTGYSGPNDPFSPPKPNSSRRDRNV